MVADEHISLVERFEIKSRAIKYPTADPERLEEIEDMAGKKNREEALAKYREEIRLAREKYNTEHAALNEEFKLALFKEHGVEGHPKVKKVFSMSWERGHSEGFSGVEYYFSELVELIK